MNLRLENEIIEIKYITVIKAIKITYKFHILILIKRIN